MTVIAVVCGGFSSEREVSLRSGRAVAEALSRSGNEVRLVDLRRDSFLAQLAGLRDAGVGFVFNALHGSPGEDGGVQAVLDALGLPYNGSGPMASSLAMHKHLAKEVVSAAGVSTPPWRMVVDPAAVDAAIGSLGLPLVIKAAAEGSTVGLTIAKTRDAAIAGFHRARECGGMILAEGFVAGTEITVPVIDHTALPIIEVRPRLADHYDYESKYRPGGSEHVIPARIPETSARLAAEAAVRACDVLGVRVYGRVDFIVDHSTGVPQFLEVNTLPGMTDLSLFPESARHAGMTFELLLERIVTLSREAGN